MRIPFHDEDEESLRLIDETPRELLLDETLNEKRDYANKKNANPAIRIVSSEFTLNVVIDPKVIMSEVAEEARSCTLFALETAIDVTAVIRKHTKGNQCFKLLSRNYYR